MLFQFLLYSLDGVVDGFGGLVEELADLLEVMGAVVKARGYTWDELTTVRKKKREERGGFEKRILLKEVYE